MIGKPAIDSLYLNIFIVTADLIQRGVKCWTMLAVDTLANYSSAVRKRRGLLLLDFPAEALLRGLSHPHHRTDASVYSCVWMAERGVLCLSSRAAATLTLLSRTKCSAPNRCPCVDLAGGATTSAAKCEENEIFNRGAWMDGIPSPPNASFPVRLRRTLWELWARARSLHPLEGFALDRGSRFVV